MKNSTQRAAEHFAGAGFPVAKFRTPEMGELSKLVETTRLSVLIASGPGNKTDGWGFRWINEEEVNKFIKEISFLRSHMFPGRIEWHCAMTDIAILRRKNSSKLLDAIVESNDVKEQQMQRSNKEKQNSRLRTLKAKYNRQPDALPRSSLNMINTKRRRRFIRDFSNALQTHKDIIYLGRALIPKNLAYIRNTGT